MISQESKDLFYKLGMEFQPVALKFCFSPPEGVERVDEVLSFCQFLRKSQDDDRTFYVSKDDENCFGKVIMGMIPKEPFEASGQAGKDFGVFKTQAPNAKLHHELTTLTPGACNYVLFSPLSQCNFDPDLVICVAEIEQAAVLMRATSYISGDFWESCATPVLSCNWIFSYPYISGKVNTVTTGLGHGMTRRKVYPPGRMIITIPYPKIHEVCQALSEMDWVYLSMRDDEESRAELRRRMDKWQEMVPDVILKD